MKLRALTIAATMFALTSIARAHTHLEGAVPAENSVLSSPPKEIMLQFSERTRLTAVSIRKEGDKDVTVVSSLPKDASVELRVPVALDGPGKYEVDWRAVGTDNHVMSGSLQFTVTTK